MSTPHRAAAMLLLAAGLTLSIGLPVTGANAIPVDENGQTPTVTRQGPAHPVLAARNATRKYKPLARAKDAGYAKLLDKDGIACIAMPGMGGMGVHFVRGDLVGTPHVRVRSPEALVYARRPDGRLRLVALEYVVFRKDWVKLHGSHPEPPRLFGRGFALTRKGNRFGLPAFYSLHAWVWKHNPAGRFAPFNPDVNCCHCGATSHRHTH